MEQRKETYMKTIIRPTSIGTTVVFTALLVLGHHELPSTEPDMNVMLSQESEHVDQTIVLGLRHRAQGSTRIRSWNAV